MVFSNVIYVSIPVGVLILLILVIIVIISIHNEDSKKADERERELFEKEELRKQRELEQKERDKKAAEIRENDLLILSRLLSKHKLNNSFEDCLKMYNLAFNSDWGESFPSFGCFDRVEIDDLEIEITREEAWERCVLYYKNKDKIEIDLYDALKKEYPYYSNLDEAYKQIKNDIIACYKKIPPSKKEMAQYVKGWEFWLDILQKALDNEEK